jgi:sugar lactone lactonase YvrE
MGALYRLELDGSCTRILTGLTIGNGIGWSPDGATMYLADSGTGRVEAFDFDGDSGDISRRRTLVRIEQPGVVPDGLTVDEEGGSGLHCGVAARSSGTPRRIPADHDAPARRSTDIVRVRGT